MKYEFVKDSLLNSTSDKETSALRGHPYGIFYELLINSLHLKVQRPISILELGVSLFGGGSLQVFSSLECVEKYVGIDIDPCLADTNKSIFHQMDAYSPNTLDFLRTTYCSFDLIIDDCIHNYEHQLYIYKNFAKILGKNGYLVIEDVERADEKLYESSGICGVQLKMLNLKTKTYGTLIVCDIGEASSTPR